MHEHGAQDAAADPADWELPGYTHLRTLGAGASGRVVLARHDLTGTPVAIKYLHDAADGPALRTEARMLARVDSPYVTRLYEYVEGGPYTALVMELVDGVSLRTLLKEEGATTPEAALVVLKGSLLGLAAAHASGLVHRDYKPANVLVATGGASKLVDFGIAVPSGADRDISGTPAYLAPEQWTGAPASPAADVYAATVTFFECLTGSRPFPGPGIAELAVQHRESRVPEELVPEQVRPLVRAGLAKRPQDRPVGAAEFVGLLDAVATAGYGEQWEERGTQDLAALVALLALLLPWGAAGPPPAGTTALAYTNVGAVVGGQAVGGPAVGGQAISGRAVGGRAVRRPILRRRARFTAGLVVGAVTAASLAGFALAGVADRSDRVVTGSPMPKATTSLGPDHLAGPGDPSQDPGGQSPDPIATVFSSSSSSPSPSTTASARPTVPPPPSPTSSPSPSPSLSPAASSSPSPPPSASTSTTGSPTHAPSPPPTTTPPTTPPTRSTPTTTSPTTPPPTPPTSKPPTTPPPVRVDSLTIDSIACDGGYGVQASVTVVTSGPPGATLVISWMHNSGPKYPNETVATDTVKLGSGRVTLTVRHQFGTADTQFQWGLRVATTPAAGSTPTPYRELYAPGCHEPG
ncbi:serine/threonine-protein kinase [Kitasatospora sp. NPDC097643]|uniref:serine/threonine-protein kinase n=1 Tax=Kitasatospora sp. NPDC097643 TaxID=3157230 RepID=UPI00331882CD